MISVKDWLTIVACGAMPLITRIEEAGASLRCPSVWVPCRIGGVGAAIDEPACKIDMGIGVGIVAHPDGHVLPL